MQDDFIQEAKATFQYNVGGGDKEITVGGGHSKGKTKAEWEADLLVDAGIEVSKITGIPRENIALVLIK